jgi:non-specific protein-tyrosine kinase
MAELIEELKTRADIILFDSPPLLAVAEAGLLARASDATLLVVACGVTRSPGLKRTHDQLLQTGTRLVGLVLNRAAPQIASYRYYSADTGNLHQGGTRSQRRRLKVASLLGKSGAQQAEQIGASRTVKNESLGR